MSKFRLKYHIAHSKAREKTDIHDIYPQTAGKIEKIEKVKKGKSVWFSPFARIFGYFTEQTF